MTEGMEGEFWRTLERYADRTALLCPEAGHVSYDELRARADDLRTRLGVERSLVLLRTDNSAAAIAAYLGALRGGHVVLLADASHAKLAANLERTYRPEAIIHRDEGEWRIRRGEGGGGGGLHPDLALILSTSGSTGNEKCVRLSHRNLAANTASIISYLGVGGTDRTALTLPLHYCYGLSVLHTHLAVGATIHCGEHTMASTRFLEFLGEERISSFAGVPHSFEILERIGLRTTPLPDLRYVTQAGGRLPPALVAQYARWAQESGKQFFVMYGQTEATARMAYLPPEETARFPSCIGRPIPGGSLCLRSETGEEIAATDVPGELVYRGPNVMMGYAAQREDLARGPELAQLATGDIACRNAEGLFYIVGRSNRISKLFGIRLNLEDAEKHLEDHGIPAVCVSDDSDFYVVLRDDARAAEARELVHEEFSIPPENIRVVAVGELPRMTSGKVDYTAVRAMAVAQVASRAEDEARGSTPGAPGGSKAERLQALYARAFRRGPVLVTDSFAGLGGDSLRFVQVSIGIDEILGTLPARWESLSIEELARERPREVAGSAVLESGVVLRAAAILCVVANHAGAAFLAGGAQLLLLASGLYFVRFQGQALAQGRILGILKNCARNFLVPYLGVLLAFQAAHRSFHLPDLLLYDNMVESHVASPFPTWFMQALLQSIVLFSLPFVVPAVRRRLVGRGFGYACTLLALAAVARVVDGMTGYGVNHGLVGKEITWVFWLFCLGAVAFHSRTSRQRIFAAGLSAVLPFAFYPGDYSRALFILLGAQVLLWVPLLRVWTTAKRPILALSVSSYFIYMLHLFAFRGALRIPFRFQVLWFLGGLALGIVGWKAYDALGGQWAARRRRLRGGPTKTEPS